MLFIDEIWEWLITLETEQALALAVLAMIGIAAWAITNPNISLSLKKQVREKEDGNDEDDVTQNMVGAISSMASSIHTLATEVSAAVKAIAVSTKQMNDTLPTAIQEAMRSGVNEAVNNMAKEQEESQRNVKSAIDKMIEILSELVTDFGSLKADIGDIKSRLSAVEKQIEKLQTDFDRLSESQRWPEVITAMATLQGEIEKAQQPRGTEVALEDE